MNRTLIEIGVALAMILGFALWERHQGAVACITHDKLEVAHQETQAAAQSAIDKVNIQSEMKLYVEAKAVPVDTGNEPKLKCVRSGGSAVPANPTTGPGDNGKRGLPGPTDTNFTAGANDPTQPVIQVGHQANAQVAALKDYINRVCLAK